LKRNVELREDSLEIASLKDSLEEEQETVASLVEKLKTLDKSENEIIIKFTKEREHDKAK
jgi:hypothetical protein